MTPRIEYRGALRITLESALLVGGYRTPTGFLDAATALDHQGLPMLPASTVRGALREACTLLLAGREAEKAGRRLDVNATCTNVKPCGRCLVCDLFGAPGVNAPGVLDGVPGPLPALPDETHGLRGGLCLGDGRMQAANREQLRLRQGVGIDDARGAALPEVLYLREVLDAPGACFEVPISARVPAAAWELLHDALPLVTSVGHGRSTGMGLVRQAALEPPWDPHAQARPAPQKPAISYKPPPEKRAHAAPTGSLPPALFTVRLEEPLAIGDGPAVGVLQRCLDYIAGSALRGAIATALLDAGVSDKDPAFLAAIAPTGLCFSDAWPAAGNELPLPMPASMLQCKHHDNGKHKTRALRDSLLLSALVDRFMDQYAAARPLLCLECKDPLKNSSQPVYPPCDLPTRVVTRVGRDSATGSAVPGLLYSSEIIQPFGSKRVTFAGTLSGLTEQSLHLLQQVGELRIGRGRSRGQGLITLAIEPSVHLTAEAIGQRRNRFAKYAGPLLKAAREAGAADLPDAKDLLPVLVRTDLALPVGMALSQAADYLAQQIAPGCRVFAAQQRPDERSGFSLGKDPHDPRPAGPRPLRPVVRAGSAYLLSGAGIGQIGNDRLYHLETDGVGLDRHLGLGRLVFAPDVFLQGIQP